MKTTKIEQLQAAILNLEEMKSDTYSMAVEFDQAKINSGLSYVSITVNPTGSWSVGSSPSWECSANEYFSESGVLSIATIYSASGCFGTPGPNDGYEWEDGDDYFGNDSGSWFTIDEAAIKLSKMDDFDGDVDDLEEEQIETELIARGFFKFSVSDRACDPDIYNNIAAELETKIDELIASIQSEVDELEAENNSDAYKDAFSRDAWYSDAYNTGFEACKQGEPREDNPYHIDAVSRDAWYRGWDDAK